ncbi:papain family cysteine protease domain-containing protein [Ditylenchus destructor]|nr:papain family cysteine protease domain-containing protein [Ditylenchus destructor]
MREIFHAILDWRYPTRAIIFPFYSLLLLSEIVSGRGFSSYAGGQYCSKREGPICCPSRDDDCTAPIMVPSGLVPGQLIDHLCYCDNFCDRESKNEGNDCCPDYAEVCLGTGKDMPFSSGRITNNESKLASFAVGDAQECSDGALAYGYGQTMRKNCQVCTCLGNEWQCDGNTCLIQEKLLEKINEGGQSWSGKNYTQFWGRTLEDGIKYRLGTLFPEQSVENMNEILIKRRELPTSFDAREKWPYLARAQIADQGDCASSWAFSTTLVAADRLAILSGGTLQMELSPQQLLDCNQHKQRGCEGGYLDRAWWYIRKFGLVSNNCYPYNSGLSQTPGICHIPKQVLSSPLAIPQCVSGSNNTIFKMTPSYRISPREEDIQTEILTNGPIQATFLVYPDFFMYSGGVYRRMNDLLLGAFPPKGYHSVKILGWGEDPQSGKYWLCANSWGQSWGENGLFRIVRGENHCEIESFIVGAWAKLDDDGLASTQSSKRRLRRRRQRRRWRIVRRGHVL